MPKTWHWSLSRSGRYEHRLQYCVLDMFERQQLPVSNTCWTPRKGLDLDLSATSTNKDLSSGKQWLINGRVTPGALTQSAASLAWLLAQGACWQKRGVWNAQSQLLTILFGGLCISVHSFGPVGWTSWAPSTCHAASLWLSDRHVTAPTVWRRSKVPAGWQSWCRAGDVYPWTETPLLCSGLGATQSFRRYICFHTTGGTERIPARHSACMLVYSVTHLLRGLL